MTKKDHNTPAAPGAPADLDALADDALAARARSVVTLPGVQRNVQDPALHEQFRVLGYDRGLYYFLPQGSRQLRAFSAAALAAGSMAALLELAPLRWWEREFGEGRDGFNKRAALGAVDWMIQASQAAGPFRPEQIRGRGVWEDAGRLVVHAGDRLLVDGVEVGLHALSSRFVYELGPPLPIAFGSPLAAGEGKVLTQLARCWGWRQGALDASLLAGWVVCAVACGALRWRPHLFLTGARASGKSSLLRPLMRLLRGVAVLPEGGMTTEAGIRQALGADALPVIFDEADPDGEDAKRRLAAVLSLMRSSSSESDSSVLKGSREGVARAFAARSMFLLAGIRVPMEQAADLDRVSVLELLPIEGTIAQRQSLFATVIGPLAATVTDPAWGARFIARVLTRVDQLRADIDTYSTAAAVRLGSQRLGEQYGALLAGAWLLASDTPVTLAEAQRHVAYFGWQEAAEVAGSCDEERLLALLLEASVVVNVERTRYDATLGELVALASGHGLHATIGPAAAAAELGRHGLAVEPAPDHRRHSEWLVISNTHRGVARALAGSAYAVGWWRLLRRLPGAESLGEARRRFAGVQSRATRVPLTLVLGAPGAPDSG